MPLFYQDSFNVYQFECDAWDRMTPGAILRRVQEIGTAQTEFLGIKEEMYKNTHTAFLLSRVSLKIFNCPKFKQKIRIEARAYGIHRAVYQRVTTLYSEETGEKLCEADSRWVLVDTESKHILRREPEGFESPFLPMDSWGEQDHEMDLKVKPTELVCQGKFNAAYSLCDRNGHINNTKYADIVCDLLPIDEFEKSGVKTMLLLYRAEIQMGKEFEIFTQKTTNLDKDGYYIVAEEGKSKNFECFVTF